MIMRHLWVFLFLFLCGSAVAGPEVTRNPNFDPANAGSLDNINPAVFGDSTNNLTITDGVITLNGTARRYITRRPQVDAVHQVSHTKPLQVQQGVFFGYSFPVFASDDEELFFKSFVPYRWDAASDPVFSIFCYLANAEDVGDYFKFQLSWEHSAHEATTLPSTTHDVPVEQIIISGGTAQYSLYHLSFVIDYDINGAGTFPAGSILAARLRRLDATNPDVDNEIVVVDWKIKYQVDKMYDTW